MSLLIVMSEVKEDERLDGCLWEYSSLKVSSVLGFGSNDIQNKNNQYFHHELILYWSGVKSFFQSRLVRAYCSTNLTV